MKIAIVTSGDYVYAGNIFIDAKSKGHNISFIDVLGSPKNLIFKKFKLIFLFGIFDSLSFLISSYRNKKYIKKSSNVRIIHKHDIGSVLLRGDFDLIILINYAFRFPLDEKINIVNCHPSLLPKFQGLMSISHNVNDALLNNLNNVKTGITVHQIDNNFDIGKLIIQKSIELPSDTKLFYFYKKTYALISECLDEVIRSPAGKESLDGGSYFSSMSFWDVLKFKLRLLKQNKFFKFIINGGLIGLVSWFLQLCIYTLLESYLSYLDNKMLISVYAAFVVSVIISFHSLKKFVFKSRGYIYRFFIVTTLIVSIVGFLTELIFALFFSASPFFSIYFSYPLAALLVAPLSFLSQKHMVFIKK